LVRVLPDNSGATNTLVVPSRQRAEALRLARARAAVAAGARVWSTPDILEANTWLTREVEAAAAAGALPRVLSSAQEWLIWRQSTQQATHQLELVARGALAEALQRASELAGDYLIPASDLIPTADDTEGRLLHEVHTAVQARFTAAGVSTARAAAARLACVGSARAVEFAGFTQVPPYLAQLSRARQLKGYATSTRALAVAERRARKIIAADRIEELERIAGWCRQLLEADPQARMLVVLPGAAGLRERLATLLRQSLAPRAWVAGEDAVTDSLVAIEGGESLARAPLVAHALTALEVICGAMPFDTLSAWLCAPYWRQPDAAARARVDNWLRSLAPLELDLATLLALLARQPPGRHAASGSAAQQLLTRLNAAALPLQAATRTPREWAERIRGALEALQWPGDAARTSAAEQTVQRFNELLNDFGELAVAVRTLNRDQALQVFNELAVRCAFRPGSGDALVTITPFLEDPITPYAGIWVAGLDASSWPQPLHMNPFLPVAAQRAAHIPAASAEGRTAEARALMAAWRAAADDLVFSCAVRDEDLVLLPSPLLKEWSSAAPAVAPPALWLPARMHREGELESLIDASGPAWPAGARLPSGTRLLELQSQCAFHAFGELRLGSCALEAPEPGVPAMERGSFLHGALEALWGRLKDSQTLKGLAPHELDAIIAGSVAHAAHELWGATLSRARLREKARARELLGVVCELERTRAAFSVRDIELESVVQLAGSHLHLRIDRVDALGDGGVAILDYKSGAHKTMDWFGEHLSHPQLLAYLLAVDEGVRAVATVNVGARDVGFHGIGAEAGLLPKLKAVPAQEGVPASAVWQESRDFWRVRIEALVRDFVDGRAVVDPAPLACKYCDVASLCRIAERGLPEDEEPDVAADD
jgi:probable DNA repair protein